MGINESILYYTLPWTQSPPSSSLVKVKNKKYRKKNVYQQHFLLSPHPPIPPSPPPSLPPSTTPRNIQRRGKYSKWTDIRTPVVGKTPGRVAIYKIARMLVGTRGGPRVITHLREELRGALGRGWWAEGWGGEMGWGERGKGGGMAGGGGSNCRLFLPSLPILLTAAGYSHKPSCYCCSPLLTTISPHRTLATSSCDRCTNFRSSSNLSILSSFFCVARCTSLLRFFRTIALL